MLEQLVLAVVNTLFDVAPIVAILLFFQLFVLRRPLPHLKRTLLGFGYVLVGLALFLSFFIMVPVFDDVYDNAVQPYMNEELPPADALQRAAEPFRSFMLGQTREADLELFADISRTEPVESDADVPFSLLLPAFVTSELKTAFQIGFLILIPFLVIDLVVASLLMSMGMMMLSPMIISLPFKIMLFVLIDGWTLVMGTLASSFFV